MFKIKQTLGLLLAAAVLSLGIIGCTTVDGKKVVDWGKVNKSAPLLQVIVTVEVGEVIANDATAQKAIDYAIPALVAIREKGLVSPQALEAAIKPIITEYAPDNAAINRVAKYVLGVYTVYYNDIVAKEADLTPVLPMLEAVINGLRGARGLDPLAFDPVVVPLSTALP